MTNDKLIAFQAQVGVRTPVLPFSSDHNPAAEAFVWLLDVPPPQVREARRRALNLALDLHDDGALTFLVGVADPVKSKELLASAVVAVAPPANAASGLATVDVENGRGQGTGPSLPLRVTRVFFSHGSAGGSNAASGTWSLQSPAAASRGLAGAFGEQASAG